MAWSPHSFTYGAGLGETVTQPTHPMPSFTVMSRLKSLLERLFSQYSITSLTLLERVLVIPESLS